MNARALLKNKSFILEKNSYGFLMNKNEAIDIDDIEDLKLAEYFSKNKNLR